MRLPHVTDLAGVDAAAVGIPFDTATSFRTGARFGPEAIRSASVLLRPYHPALDVDVPEALSVVDYGDLPVAPGHTEGTYKRIEAGLAALVDAGVFPLVLGGDHSITLAELRALASRYRQMALVQLDSHTDTWDEYFDQRYFHGTTFKRAAEEGLRIAPLSECYLGEARRHGLILGYGGTSVEEIEAGVRTLRGVVRSCSGRRPQSSGS